MANKRTASSSGSKLVGYPFVRRRPIIRGAQTKTNPVKDLVGGRGKSPVRTPVQRRRPLVNTKSIRKEPIRSYQIMSRAVHRSRSNQTGANKSGQIQLFESIAVLMVFFVIVAFALVFYFFIAKSSAQSEHQTTLELEAITTAQRVSTLPELDCIQVGVHVEKCFDELKLKTFQTLISDPKFKEDYFDTLGYTQLIVKKVHPNSVLDCIAVTGVTGCVFYDNPPVSTNDEIANLSYSKTFLPINLYNPQEKMYSFGVLEVKTYER